MGILFSTRSSLLLIPEKRWIGLFIIDDTQDESPLHIKVVILLDFSFSALLPQTNSPFYNCGQQMNMNIKFIQCIVSDVENGTAPVINSFSVPRSGGSNLITGCYSIFKKVANGMNSSVLSIIKQGMRIYSVDEPNDCHRPACYTTSTEMFENETYSCCCNAVNCNREVAIIQATQSRVFREIITIQSPHVERITILALASIVLILLGVILTVMKTGSRLTRTPSTVTRQSYVMNEY